MYLSKETLNISLQLLTERERKVERKGVSVRERKKEKDVHYRSTLLFNDRPYISHWFSSGFSPQSKIILCKFLFFPEKLISALMIGEMPENLSGIKIYISRMRKK